MSAPVLSYLFGRDYGWWVSAIALFALISKLRHPLRDFWQHARGQEVELPAEFRQSSKP